MLLQRINDKYSGMSASQQKIARFLMNRCRDVPFSSVAELAAKIGTSPATVIRFCASLGYKGYTDMQRELQSTLSGGSPAGAHPGQPPRSKTEDVRLNAIGRDIMSAEHVLVIGHMESLGIAAELYNALGAVRRRVYMTMLMRSDWGYMLRLMEENTLVLAVSFSPHYAYTFDCTKTAKSKGCRVVALTDSTISPYAALADYHVTFELERRPGTVLIDTSPAVRYIYSLLNHIYSALSDGPEGRARDKRLFIEG